jgi:hypothetical protein
MKILKRRFEMTSFIYDRESDFLPPSDPFPLSFFSESRKASKLASSIHSETCRVSTHLG